MKSLLDAFSQQTPDSRPNTAPAGTRGTGATATATGGTTSASGVRPTGSSSKPRNGGTSSSPATTVPSAGTTSGASVGPKGGPIQMSALSSVLANLSASNPSQGATDGAAAATGQPAIDLYDIMNSEVSEIVRE